jgi:methylmalonyl-CoA mutase cobalamin-binding subunit
VTIRLYLDEDSMRRSLVRALQARGVDVITVLDAGMIEREDREHLDYATRPSVVYFQRTGFLPSA